MVGLNESEMSSTVVVAKVNEYLPSCLQGSWIEIPPFSSSSIVIFTVKLTTQLYINASNFQDVLDQAVHLDEPHHHHPQPELLLLRQAEYAQRRSDHRVPAGHPVCHRGN